MVVPIIEHFKKNSKQKFSVTIILTETHPLLCILYICMNHISLCHQVLILPHSRAGREGMSANVRPKCTLCSHWWSSPAWRTHITRSRAQVFTLVVLLCPAAKTSTPEPHSLVSECSVPSAGDRNEVWLDPGNLSLIKEEGYKLHVLFFLKADLNEQKTLKFSLIKHKILNGTLTCTFFKNH